MKKPLLICFLLLSCFPGFSQFVLTPGGFVIEGQRENPALEIEFEGRTQNELFRKTMSFFEEVFHDNRGLLLLTVRNEEISIDGLIEDAVKWRKFGRSELYMDMVLTQTFRFRNGRISAGIPDIHEMFSGNLPAQLIKVKDHAAGGVYIYNKNGKLKYPVFRESLENFFNELIHELIRYIDNGEEHNH